MVHDDDTYPSVKWTTPINQLIRADFVLEDQYATSHTTIEDALSHRTGLPGHDLVLGQANDTPSKVAQRMRYLPMTAQPRTQWQYCNMMYGVITDLLQVITGKHLEALLREKFWLPLGMLSTTFKIPSDEPERSRLARGYYWSSQTNQQLTLHDNGTYIPDVYLNLLSTAGDGATISTVNDYSLWIRALLNAASDEDFWNLSSPITRDVYHDLVTPRAIIPEAESQQSSTELNPLLYALGWMTADVGSLKLVAHSGGITGFGTQVVLLPGRNYGVVTMGNTFWSSLEASATIVSKLLVEKFNLTAERTVSALSVHETLSNVQRACQHSATFTHRRMRTSSSLRQMHARTEHLPLPLPLSSFTGRFFHPAYGTINLTIPNPIAVPPSPYSSEQVLETLFYRTSVEKEVLRHISGTLFEVRSFEPHGLDDIVTGEGIVWEELGDEDWEAYATFESGMDGQKIEKVGIELEPDMIFAAREKGNKSWKEGMIWFERLGE